MYLPFARRDADYRSILLDFRADMFQRLTIITALFSALAGYAVLLIRPLPYQLFFLAFGFSACALFFRQLAKRYPNGARYGFVISLYAGLFTEMLLLPDSTLPFLIFPILLISALLMSNTNLLAALIFFAFTALLNLTGRAEYRLDILALLLGFMVAVTNTTVLTFNIALQWYSSMHKRADDLLNEARERRAELVQTLKSLEAAYDTQQRLQQQLLYARKQADEARRTKDRFAANISHELRTPLNLILGFSEIMYLTPEVYGIQSFSPTLQRDISQIHRSSKHLLAMIDDVLDLSHIDASQFSLNFERTETTSFLEETADMIANLFKGTVTFTSEIEPHLPALEIDRTRIRQVLINLITNAQRFTAQGSVTLSAQRNRGEVLIQITDTGSGIAPDKLTQIFDEFYQVDYSLSRKHGGAGLGLSITRRFVEAHNGTITVESTEGSGSTFTVSLPIPETRRLDWRRAERSYDFLEQKIDPVVLVAEQDPRIVSMLARHLPEYKVVPVTESQQIDESIRRYSPRALVMNRLPGATRSPEYNYPIPVIECSLPSTTWMVNQLGVAACLAKPVRPQDIIAQLERFPDARNILVVDDDLGVVQLVQRSIEALGRRSCTILRAYDGQQALETLRQNVPDLLLLDLAMPETNGFDVLDTMQKENLNHIPTILLTATQYIDHEGEMLAEMVVRQPKGLRPMEAIKAIHALVNLLEPR